MTLYGGYAGLLRELLLQYKFHSRIDTGLTLARMLASVYTVRDSRPAAVVPVPLHSRRLLTRGHNQSLLLARLLAEKAKTELWPKLLRRTRATTPQANLLKKDRRHNLVNAFTATIPKSLRGTRILLVDDITTTGATLTHATRALLDAGAGSVEVAIVARTPEPDNLSANR